MVLQFRIEQIWTKSGRELWQFIFCRALRLSRNLVQQPTAFGNLARQSKKSQNAEPFLSLHCQAVKDLVLILGAPAMPEEKCLKWTKMPKMLYDPNDLNDPNGPNEPA